MVFEGVDDHIEGDSPLRWDARLAGEVEEKFLVDHGGGRSDAVE